ncbi:MAG: hypothetical protein NUV46_00470 [Nanoarchaeota archaeon]|nr:hypothetical protein [Nanoarchaeota archaeon]
MKFNHETFLNFSGWFLILFSVLNISFKIYYGFGDEVLWLCNNAPIIIGVGILFRNQKIVLGIFSLLFVGSLGWNFDAFSFLVFGETFFGADGSFLGRNLTLQVLTILNHSSTFLLSFISIFLINKKEKFAWVYGLIYGLILAGFSFLFPEKNYNCILESCVDLIPTFKFYTLVYIGFYLGIFMIPFNWIINKFMKK